MKNVLSNLCFIHGRAFIKYQFSHATLGMLEFCEASLECDSLFLDQLRMSEFCLPCVNTT